ncbi:cysteine dioxygenase [Desmospora activa]|uniref:Cysteine dioxygenase n=1 Tax=Desmospora activa DSM 45169 TaxID=1121389 RepID=A0A2T4ZBX2_9BACL|nr:cysteine dioxygenase family protein [Desmospora activa]PTM59394.1 Cysteine dioxygenase [Desmospora activa DSM 45169]
MNLAQQLRDFLESVEQPCTRKVEKAIQTTGCTLERIAPFIKGPGDRLKYGRNVILRSDLFEGLVINLPGGVATPVHDHGESMGCVYVISGAFINRLYMVEENSSKVMPFSESRVDKGESLFIERGVIHSMYNPGKERMISLHVYFPPLSGNRIYPSEVVESF